MRKTSDFWENNFISNHRRRKRYSFKDKDKERDQI